jgi:signal transduction histidine kinase
MKDNIGKIPINALMINKLGTILEFSEFAKTSDLLSDFFQSGNTNVHDIFARETALEKITEIGYRCYFIVMNKILEVVCIKIEISEDKFLLIIKDELKTIDDASKFMCNLSKEVKSPLNDIFSCIAALNTSDLTIEHKHIVSKLKSSCILLIEVINDILDYSRLESGNLPLELKPFSIVNCIKKTHNIYHSKADDKKINMEIVIDKDIPEYVVGDSPRIQQILLNLYSNSLKCTESGGKIKTRVSLTPYKKTDNLVSLLFSIKDTGCGIDVRNHDLLFKSYTQLFSLYSTSETKKPGSGLGLAICKKLCYLMGGEIWLNRSDSTGSEFCFKIHVDKVSGYGISKDISQINKAILMEKHILIIDSDITDRIAICGILTSWGANVYPCSTSEEAFMFLKTKIKFTAILLDISKKNSMVLANKIKDTAKNIPLLALSSIGGKLTPSIKESFAYLLIKPIKEKEIIPVLADIFENKTDCCDTTTT